MKQQLFTKGRLTLWLGAALLLGGCTEVSTATTAVAADESGNTAGLRIKSEDVSMDCIPGEGLPGGWHHQTEVSDDAKAALASVLAQMNTAAKLKTIREVRTQVVAGINYAIEFELDNGEVWNTVVFRDLKGNFSMKQVAKQGRLIPFCPPK